MDQITESLKLPPHSIDAEQSILGGLLLNNDSWDHIAGIVNEDDFYRRDHRLIFKAIREQIEEGKPCDVVTLSERLESHNTIDDVGGLAYLGSLVNNTPSASNVRAYSEIVRERSVLRQLIQIGNEIADNAFNPEGRKSDDILEAAEKTVFEIADKGANAGNDFKGMTELLKKTVDRIDELYQSGGNFTGIPTGFTDFDGMTSGLQPADLVIVAGRPSMGKCLVADSEIVLEDGSVETIETLYQKKSARLLTLKNDWKLHPTQASAFVDDGRKPVFRLTTRLGKVIESTATHPFLTPSGWKPLAEIRTGTRVAVPGVIPVSGQKPMPSCKIKLLAYCLSSHSMAQSPAHFSHADPVILQDFIQVAEQFRVLQTGLKQYSFTVPVMDFALVTGMHLAGPQFLKQGAALSGIPWLDGIAQWFAGVSEKSPLLHRTLSAKNNHDELAIWLQESGLRNKNAHQQKIPAKIFTLPKEQLSVFINRLFATDGRVTVHDNHPQLGYSSVSEPLIRQLQHLLLRFGVLAQLRQSRVRLQNKSLAGWQLDITDNQSIAVFIREIGIFSRVKALENILADLESRGHKTHYTDSDVYWDEVVSIDAMGLKQVYDLTIPETHNFVANDICVHNTTFAMNMAENAAIGAGVGVAVFSMEMPAESLTLRMLSSLGRINQTRVRSGQLDEDDWPRLTSAVSILNEANIFIDDTPALSPTEMRARVRRLKRKHNIGLIVVDYLQLMQVKGHSENRVNEISEISRGLKALAKEMNVPVVALSQLNRGLEQRPNKRPVMSDLRESGAIEQDADLIVFIYRDEVYNEDSPDKGTAEIIIGKQRNGPLGISRLTFLGQFTKFENHASIDYED